MKQLKDDMIPFITTAEIEELVTSLAQQIEKEYFNEELVMICPLKGSVIFMADLIRKINLPIQVDFIKITSASDYKNKSNVITIEKDISVNVKGKNVIIVEEIIDTAKTLSFLKNRLLAAGPASLAIVTLIDKPARRAVDLKPDFIGKTIDDRYVVGYGMDEGELCRNYKEIFYPKN